MLIQYLVLVASPSLSAYLSFDSYHSLASCCKYSWTRVGSALISESWEVKVKTSWRCGENLRCIGDVFKDSGRGFGASALRSRSIWSSLKVTAAVGAVGVKGSCSDCVSLVLCIGVRLRGVMISSSGLSKGTMALVRDAKSSCSMSTHYLVEWLKEHVARCQFLFWISWSFVMTSCVAISNDGHDLCRCYQIVRASVNMGVICVMYEW